MDQLSEVFDLVEVRSVVSGGFAVRGPWITKAVLRDSLKFLAVVSGRATLTTEASTSEIILGPGDVAVLNQRSWFELRGGLGDGPPREVEPDAQAPGSLLVGADRQIDDVIIGGHVELNATGEALLLQALPPVAHVAASEAPSSHLNDCLDRLFDEIRNARIGSDFAMRQYGQLFLLEVLRTYVEQAELPPGWLRILTDERVRPALTLMHSEPGRPWQLEELARAAAMSRTNFSERFRRVAGQPPLAYLSRWRMLLAQRALQDSEVRIGALATKLGYASDSAFSTAFKREVGQSPLQYRIREASSRRTTPDVRPGQGKGTATAKS
jgi:AraC-like DNA-binding protein